jgi:hypothetical protein
MKPTATIFPSAMEMAPFRISGPAAVKMFTFRITNGAEGRRWYVLGNGSAFGVEVAPRPGRDVVVSCIGARAAVLAGTGADAGAGAVVAGCGLHDASAMNVMTATDLKAISGKWVAPSRYACRLALLNPGRSTLAWPSPPHNIRPEAIPHP